MVTKVPNPIPYTYMPLRWWRDETGRLRHERVGDIVLPAYLYELIFKPTESGRLVPHFEISRYDPSRAKPGPKLGTKTVHLDGAESEILRALERAQSDAGKVRPSIEAIGLAYESLFLSRSSFYRRWRALKDADRLPANY